jgi:hypothetical protein
MEFYATMAGKKFFRTDFPSLLLQLKRIADGLEDMKTEIEPIAAYGKFEEITPEEQTELNAKRADFDKWYKTMCDNFELVNTDSIDMASLKNLVRHAWLVNN